jgi:hypothetical protein
MKPSIHIFCCLYVISNLTFLKTQAQELTGIWRGHFRSNDIPERLAGNYDDRYKMEVQIAQTNNRFEAITYSYKSTEFYGKAEASGTLNPRTKKVLLKEGKLLEVRYASGNVCIMTCFLQYSKLGNDEYLQGTYYSTIASDTAAGCGKGSIFLHRVIESDFHKEPLLEEKEKQLLARKKPEAPVKSVSPPPITKTSPKPVEPVSKTVPKPAPVKKQIASAPVTEPATARKKSMQVVPQNTRNYSDSSLKVSEPVIPTSIPEVLKTRTNTLLKTISVSHNSIELRIYDDGAIDNDTVSVYYDQKLIISKARLTDQPIIVRIPVEPSEHPHELVMVAENLGEIPPNTSLLVVRDGEKRYEERIISTEQKNVVIGFLFKKTE